MRSSMARTGLVLASAWMMLACAPANALPGRERTMERTVSAAQAREIAVKGRVGEIKVVSRGGDDVVIRLRLKPKRVDGWFFSGREGDPEKADLVTETRGNTLHLDIRYPDDRDGLEEFWSLEVPERMAARLNLGVGNVEVRGLSGGLELRVNVGDIIADIPEGNVDAEVNVGDVRVTTGTNSYGRVRLEANVGGTRISGASGIRPVKRSRGYGPGDSASLDGGGRDRIRLEVNVGGAELRFSTAN